MDQRQPPLLKPAALPALRPARPSLRARWLRPLLQWHWISSALCLAGMLLFALTGITLNHAGQIEASPQIEQRQAALPAAVQAELAELAAHGKAPLPALTRAWLDDTLALSLAGRTAQWEADEIYLDLPRPGGDGWLRIDRNAGLLDYERTDRGWIAYLNDLHKGRHAGALWRGFIDLFSAACVLFSLTGLAILALHAPNRRGIWPVTGLGLALPVLVALFSFH